MCPSTRSAPVAMASCLALLLAGVAAGQSPQAPAAAGPPGGDHAVFDALLAAHVDDAGRVDYDAFAASPDFDAYLEQLARADPARLDDDGRLALWINAYNAWTIELVNRHDERDSIRNINKLLGFIKAMGPWKERLARVADTTWTLDEIEHEIIRERFDEPRIHMALVCAALGCPPLRREAYTGPRLDAQLDDQTRRFLLDSPQKNRVDVAEKTVYLSPVFDWFREDFPPGREGLGRWLARWHPPGPARALLASGDFDIEHTEYDWSLNLQEEDGSPDAAAGERRARRR